MEALSLQPRGRLHPYACQGLVVSPNPPQVGLPTKLALTLTNPGPELVVVSRVAFKIARFGMGARWEELPPLGPFQVPVDPAHQEVVQQEWTPTAPGHRCVQALIQIEKEPVPLHVQRNLHVIESSAERTHWQMPFVLGNPAHERMPLTLRVEGSDARAQATVIVDGRLVRAGVPIWLNPDEEVEALLLLRATNPGALASVTSVEAFLGGQFLDGIQVVVQRAALRSVPRREDEPGVVAVEQEALVAVG